MSQPAGLHRALSTVPALLIALGALLLVYLSAPPAASAQGSCPDRLTEIALLALTPAQVRRIEDSTMCLVNEERAKRGRAFLVRNARLDAAARSHAQDMVAHGYFGHTDRQGRGSNARILGAGWPESGRWLTTGENLAWGAGWRSRPRAIVDAWLESPSHRSNMLSSDYEEIGIGLAQGAPQGGIGLAAGTYATTFGRRAGTAPATASRSRARVTRISLNRRVVRRSRGTRLTLRAAEGGTVTLSYRRRARGRVARTPTGTVTRRLAKGTTRLRLTRRTESARGRARTLPRGSYRLEIRATDRFGRTFARVPARNVRVR